MVADMFKYCVRDLVGMMIMIINKKKKNAASLVPTAGIISADQVIDTLRFEAAH